jgi:cystathionine beta-lyase
MKGGSESSAGALLNSLELFAMGFSWGGFESLAIPFDPSSYRSAVPWQAEGKAFRLHVGLDDADDLILDLDRALHAWNKVNG